MKYINTEQAPAAIGQYSQAIIVNNVIYTSGQIPINPATGKIDSNDIIWQTHQAINNLKAILESAGTLLDNVVKTTVFVQNMADFTTINEIYAKYFSNKPARSLVEVAKLPKDALIEIEAVALIK